jgi:hypothetical protein
MVGLGISGVKTLHSATIVLVCCTVKKIFFSKPKHMFQRHPEGVAQITFREPEEADACVTLLNGRWFGQRKITAETWDGKTKYK